MLLLAEIPLPCLCAEKTNKTKGVGGEGHSLVFSFGVTLPCWVRKPAVMATKRYNGEKERQTDVEKFDVTWGLDPAAFEKAHSSKGDTTGTINSFTGGMDHIHFQQHRDRESRPPVAATTGETRLLPSAKWILGSLPRFPRGGRCMSSKATGEYQPRYCRVRSGENTGVVDIELAPLLGMIYFLLL